MASLLRFGTSSGPSRMSSEERVPGVENDDKGSCDPEKLIQCPFDTNHQIRSCRFPYHLIKCRKNHPKLAQELKTCPFNARHLVHKHELSHHIKTCEDRISVDPEDDKTAGSTSWHFPVNTCLIPNMAEDWDMEVDDGQTPFVWGVNSRLTQTLASKPSNNLGPKFRAPATLPWSGYEL